MDTERIFRIIKDILVDEKNLTVPTFLDQIGSHISQNNSSGYASAKALADELSNKITQNTTSYNFSKTELEILRKIGDAGFFGTGLISELTDVLFLPSYEGVARVNIYKKERADFILKIQKLETNLADLGITEYRPENSEIGIILPNEHDDSDLVYKKIKEFEQLVKVAQELIGSDETQVKINRVSNGSLEFFTSQPVAVIMVITTILANISQIWDKIATLKKRQIDTENDKILGVSTKVKIKKALEEEIALIKKEIEEELPQRIVDQYAGKNLSKERKNEIRNHIRAKAKLIFTWFEIGIEIDIIPVKLESNDDTPEQDAEAKKVLSEIKTTNQLLKKIYDLPSEIKKLPFPLDAEDNEDTDETAK